MNMIPVNRKFLRGDIYYANLEPHLGSEQGGIRPVVVVQNNTANCYSPNLIVAPVTSNTAKKPDHQAHVLVDGNRAFLQPSMILAESVQTISKGRLIRPMGRLHPGTHSAQLCAAVSARSERMGMEKGGL